MLLCWLLMVILTIVNIQYTQQTLDTFNNNTSVFLREDAKLGDWPWMVELGYQTATNPGLQFKCGGSLISNRWIVTAAQCVSNIRTFNLTTVRVGDLDLNDNGEDGANHIDIPIDTIIPHPEYSPYPITNDIALIRLKYPVTFTKLIHSICILSKPEHKSNEFYSERLSVVIGWDTSIKKHENKKNILQKTQIKIIDTKKCEQNYANQRNAIIDERVLCAEEGNYTYTGYSGGPLMMRMENTYYLAGIVSYGVTKIADPKYPGVYTRVAQYADWITRTAELSSCTLYDFH